MLERLQQIARGTAQRMGRESLLIRTLRPAYETVLGAISGGRGVPWEINGVVYRVNPRERNRFAHIYDAPVARLLQQRIRPGAVCLDVGANAGIYVLQLAHWSQPDGRVIAFEPNPAARRILEDHVHLNGLAGRVEIVPRAVGAESGKAILFAAEASGMSRLGEANRELHGQAAPVHVEVVTLDRYCTDAGIVPQVLLMDIEGFEIAALAGAAGLIRERGKEMLMVVEMHPAVWGSAGTTRASAEALLAGLGLRAVPLTGQKEPLVEYGQVLLERVQR